MCGECEGGKRACGEGKDVCDYLQRCNNKVSK